MKESGFEDIEDECGYIDRGSWDFRTRKVQHSYQTKLDYYYLAAQFLNDYKFDNRMDETVWMYHSEGMSEREIVELLKPLNLGDWCRATIGSIIRRLNREMKEFYANGHQND